MHRAILTIALSLASGIATVTVLLPILRAIVSARGAILSTLGG